MLMWVVGLALHAGVVEDVDRLQKTLVLQRASGDAVASMGRRLLDPHELVAAFSTVPAAQEFAARAQSQKAASLPLAILAGVVGGAGAVVGRLVSVWAGLGLGVVAVALLVVAIVFDVVGDSNRMRAIWTWNRAQLEALGPQSAVSRTVAEKWVGPCEDGAISCLGGKAGPHVDEALLGEPNAKAALESARSHAASGLLLSLLSLALDGGAVGFAVIGASLMSLPLIVVGVGLLAGSLVVGVVGLSLLKKATGDMYDGVAAYDSALLSRLRREPIEGAAPGVTLFSF